MAAVLKKRALAEYSQTIQDNVQAPLKKLRLIKGKEVSSSALTLINCIESCKNSNDALQTLLRISDCFDFDTSDIPEAIRKLSEHFKTESESAVRVKILSLLSDIGSEPGTDITAITEETISLMKNEKSHKVIAQGMSTLLKLGKLNKDSISLHQKLIEISKNYLKDVSHAVKCKCLELIGAILPANSTSEMDTSLKLIGSYFHSEDARVRSQAFKTMITLHERGIKLNDSMYGNVCDALKDDYEIVRQAALKLIWIIGKVYPENIIILPESEQRIRLADDAFGKICTGVTDLSMYVRMLAAQLLGTMTVVSPKFLNQTLDKKLMSNMRKKRSAHELAWENVTSGEWASGKKWADDAPRECLDADTINLMSSGACGAFVHGLEDEFLEVRSASVESLCQLSENNPHFANTALDFLVDMFNDEIEDVRLKAIDSLRCISSHITLREDQLETILGAIEDFSQEVREGLHGMLAACRIATTAGLQMCVEKLLDNLKRYPQDRRSTFKCLQKVGAQHPELVLPLVPQFLSIHPFFDMAEPDVDSPSYICLLILIFNAAKFNSAVIQLLEPHTLRHYAYLHDTMPTLVPQLIVQGHGISTSSARPVSTTESLMFIKTVISSLESAGTSSIHLRSALLEKAKEHLNRLAEKDQGVAGTAQFTAQYISAHLLMNQILHHGYWSNPRGLATQQANTLRSNLQQLLNTCLKLQHLFVGLTPMESLAIKQFRLRALAINLVYIVKGSNASALAPCHYFLSALEEVQKELADNKLEPDAFSVSAIREIGALEEPKPGTVARLLIPVLQNAPVSRIPEPNVQVQMSSAIILEPSGQTDTTLKFTAGLIMAVPFEAELRHLADPSRLRLKVKYPDQLTQVVLPRAAHLKPLDFDSEESREGSNLRLLTTVLVSHQVWTEACNVDINIAIAVPEADMGRRRTNGDITPTLIDLCKPVRVSVAPKPVKRNL